MTKGVSEPVILALLHLPFVAFDCGLDCDFVVVLKLHLCRSGLGHNILGETSGRPLEIYIVVVLLTSLLGSGLILLLEPLTRWLTLHDGGGSRERVV